MNNMKKLLLLLLLVSSFSANALSIKIAAPCLDDESIAKKLIIQERINDINLSNLDKDSSAYKEQVNELNKYKADFIFSNKEKINDLDGNFFNILFMLSEKCKKSPEGNLVNGKRDGRWTWYDQYNEWTKYGNYIKGLREGLWIEQYTDSDYVAEMYYKNDVLDGKYTFTEYAGPYLSQEIQYKKNELNEMIKLAKLGVNQDLVNDLTKQLEAIDYPKIIVEGYYVNGKRDGYWKENRQGGGNYINGIKDGPWNEGSEKGSYINGNRDGTWSYSYSFGEVYKEEIYDNGVLIEKKFKNVLSTAVPTPPADWYCNEGYIKSSDGTRCVKIGN